MSRLFTDDGAAWSDRPPPPVVTRPANLAEVQETLGDLIDEAVERDRDGVLRLAEWFERQARSLRAVVRLGDEARARLAAEAKRAANEAAKAKKARRG